MRNRLEIGTKLVIIYLPLTYSKPPCVAIDRHGMAGAIDGVVAAHVPAVDRTSKLKQCRIAPPLGVAGNHYTRLYACYCEQFGGDLIICRVIGRCVVRFGSSGRAFALCIPIRSYVQYGNVC